MTVWRVVLPYAVFSLDVRDGRVVDAAPIGRWMIGKPFETVTAWIAGKGGTCEYLLDAAPGA